MTEETLFAATLEKATKAERDAFLEEACAGDSALRRRIEALLESHDDAEFLKTSAVEFAAIAFGGCATTEPAVGTDLESPIGFLEPSEKPGSLGRLGHHEVLEVIGRGGMGVVLRAFDEKLHRVVAIKVMAAQLATTATARRRFAREARAAAAVTHDHIVTIHAVEEAGGLPYLVMHYVAGMSLQQRLEGHGPLQLPEILRIGMQVASGLEAAHAQGLIHRDIKPANILLENGVERVKITDFGLARAADDASQTHSGVVAGTPQYMAPEQARGEAVDRRADLFSLGSVLYAMCTGRAPFRASGTMATLKRVIEEQPSPIRQSNPEIPNWLVAIIEKLHSKNPADRYQSAAEVAEVLGQYLAHLQQPSVVRLPMADTPASALPARRLRRWAAIAAGVLCLLAGVGFSEATGVTKLTSTVIRILTPDGTLVVEASDPSVKITVEGDGDLVITGAGAQEVRLRPGSYRVSATKGGKPVQLDRELVTISRNDKQVVRVRLEGDGTAAAAVVERGAFVVIGGRGVPERRSDTLAGAVLAATDGDTIEVRGNGPFVIPPLHFGLTPVTVRAARGYRPVLQFEQGTKDENGFNVSVIASATSVNLEGLEIRGSSVSDVLIQAGVSLHAANCRFLLPNGVGIWTGSASKRCVLKNCEILSGGNWTLAGDLWTGTRWEIDDCVQVGGRVISMNTGPQDVEGASIQLTRSTLVCHSVIELPLPAMTAAISAPPHESVPLGVSDCVISSILLTVSLDPFVAARASASALVDVRSVIQRIFDWRGERNAYTAPSEEIAVQSRFVVWVAEKSGTLPEVPADIDGWRQFSGSAETGSLEGRIRLTGGDLRAKHQMAPFTITPEDFRLRPDSAGYRAGPEGKDLGADVDLVGPGAAYERWKKLPEYQEWLDETRLTK